MIDDGARVEREELQFDRAVTGSTASAASGRLGVGCAVCQASIETAYFDVNGKTFCNSCRAAAQSAAETPAGIVPFITAGVFGLGAGIVGAGIYYAVMAIANLEIGIVAILIGYMVGYAVRRGASGRGARRFQVLAVALTYASIALAYSPIAIRQLIEADQSARRAPAGSTSFAAAVAESEGPAASEPARAGGVVSFVFLGAFIAALPALVVLGSFPSGLIGAFIIFLGMRQAWRMTAAPVRKILGPYRVGAPPAIA